MDSTLLSVRNVTVEFALEYGVVRAIDNVSFDIAQGERVGLVGESGSGKSVIGQTVMGLVRPPGRIVKGEVLFGGVDLTRQPPSHLDQVRGRRIALIPQDATLALTPTLRIGKQMREVITRHLHLSDSEAEDRCVDTLRRVGLSDPPRIMRAFASELSGGMKQRVAIAIALLCDPELLIADDPTSAVDVTIQAQILQELRSLTETLGLSVLFITHDLRVVSAICSRVVVLYAGQVAEVIDAQELLTRARHPYTRALVECAPDVSHRITPLPTVPGAAPDGFTRITGCRFHPRCQRMVERCPTDVPSLEGDRHSFACWNPIP